MSAPGARTGRHSRDRPVRLLLGECILLPVRALLWVGFAGAGAALNMWASVVLLLMFAPSVFWGYLAVGFGAAVVGGVGGGITGFGQVLALRRWLDTPASLGSFFSTILASSSALISGTLSGWGMHAVAGDLAGTVAGVLMYGLVFGLVQRPMLDNMSRHAILWVPANAIAAVLGAMSVLAAYEVSGGRLDMLQLRYAGLQYALVTGIAFLRMTPGTRKALSPRRRAGPGLASDASADPYSLARAQEALSGPALLEIYEQHIYRLFEAARGPNAASERSITSSSRPPDTTGTRRDDEASGGEEIDTTYRVLS